MIGLIPIISGKEANENFAKEIVKYCDKAILLMIMDKDFGDRTTAALGNMRTSRKTFEELSKLLTKEKISFEEATEWGSTSTKIVSRANYNKVDKVFLVKQETEFYREIINALKENKIMFEEVSVLENV
jgi:hypothetical protein